MNKLIADKDGHVAGAEKLAGRCLTFGRWSRCLVLALTVSLVGWPGISPAKEKQVAKSAQPQSLPTWPMRISPDLSSGFGDPREGRFHAGIDLRTGGVIGQPVFAPVDGSVTRLRAAYTGYGKAIYLTDAHGEILVFAHLSGFAPRLDTVVKRDQVAAQRYLLDQPIPKDSLIFHQGELLGWSGQTGVGAPHLHFEVRTPDNFPIHPLKQGFAVPDNIPPVLRRLYVQLLDGSALLPNGSRQDTVAFLSDPRTHGYRLTEPLVMSEPFGFLVQAEDRLRDSGMSVGVYGVRLEIDHREVYRSSFDSLDFEDGTSVRLEYDYLMKSDGDHDVRTLFTQTGNRRNEKFPPDRSGHLGSLVPLSYGRHEFTLTLSDAAMNSTILSGTLYWVPAQGLDSVLSVKKTSDTSVVYQLKLSPHLNGLATSTAVDAALPKGWEPYTRGTVRRSGDQCTVTVVGAGLGLYCLRLHHRTKDGGEIVGLPFTTNTVFGVKQIQGSHEILPDGLRLTIKTNSRQKLIAIARLFSDSLLLDSLILPMTMLSQYDLLVPPSARLANMTRIEYKLTLPDSTGRPIAEAPTFNEDKLHITALGYRDQDTIPFSAAGSLIVAKSALFTPRFVELKQNTVANRSALGIVADHFKLIPDFIALREPLQLRLLLSDTAGFGRRAGMVWLDEKKNKWTWIPTSDLATPKEGPFVVNATTYGGGSFSIAEDPNPPVMSALSVTPGRYLSDPRPKISFRLTDDLSGIPDDRAIEIYIGKEWMIPEFDPEQSLCTFQPLTPLPDGEHRVALKIRDRAGNVFEDYFRFTVRRDTTQVTAKKRK